MFVLTGMWLNCAQMETLFWEKILSFHACPLRLSEEISTLSHTVLRFVKVPTSAIKSQRYQSDLKMSKSVLSRLCCLHFIAQNSYCVLSNLFLWMNFRRNIWDKVCKWNNWEVRCLRRQLIFSITMLSPQDPSLAAKRAQFLNKFFQKKNFKNCFNFIQIFVHLKTERA